ncbi:TPA: phage tail spike protein [Streptococcus suis]
MIYLKDGNIPLNLAYDDDIVQEANSTYQLSFKFPLTDGKWHLLKREVFLLADDLHGEQEFFIFEVKKVNGYVQVYAKQVATLLNYYSINSIAIDRVPGQTAMTALAGSIKRNCPFTFFSDIMDRHTFNESNVSVMDALVKDKHSIVGQWGGDLVRDKYQVKLLKNGGIENESLFMYKKNLSSYEESENINNLKTRLHLKKIIQGQSEGEEDRVLAVTVDSPLINQYSQIYEADIEVNDQDVTDEASLLVYGQRYFSSTLCDLVENSINLDVKGESDVAVKMFDTVSVFHERFDVDLRLKITSYHFAPMSKRLKSIGFGKVSQSFGSTVTSMVAGSVDKATEKLSASFERKLQREIDTANRHFDAEFEKRVEEINDGIEQSKAEAERYADAIKQEIATEINDLDTAMQSQAQEHDRQVADILSKTQSVESLANQAKSDAASALARANQAKTEAIADARAQVATVSQTLNTAKTELQSAIASADQKARDSQASATALRNDLNLQASKILAQAQAQTALTSRVTTVENLADGTKTTVAELSKTLSKATGDITSVTSRTKTVEDTLSQTRAQYEALTQTINTQTGQIDTINRKTADLQSGIDGVTERFENIKIGSRNYLRNASFISNSQYWYRNQDQNLTYNLNHSLTNKGKPGLRMYSSSDNAVVGRWKGIEQRFKIQQPANTDYVLSLDLAKDGVSTDANIGLHFIKNGEIKQQAWFKVNKSEIPISYKRFVFKAKSTFDIDAINVMVYVGYDMIANLYVTDIQLEVGNIASDFQLSDEDLRSEFATYIRTATENSAELVRRIETADGKAVDAKNYAQQTATAINTRLESLETYKDAEGTRAEQYLSASRTETAKQLTAERTAIANNYVAKSIYDENVRGTTLKLNEIKSTADTAKQNLATYQNTVDKKLEELTSSTQTLDGKISTASSKVDTVAGQIRTEISEVEGKIPTGSVGNMLVNSGRGWRNQHSQTFILADDIKAGETYTVSAYWWRTDNSTLNVGIRPSANDSWQWVDLAYDSNFDCWTATFKATRTISAGNRFYFFTVENSGIGSANWATLVSGAKAMTKWQPSLFEVADNIESVKTTITQTASGIEQLSTSLTATDSKVTTAEANIRNLVDEVSSKVSQTDYNTLTGRVDDNETAITQNAQEISKRLTSTQVDKAITDKGYATVTVLENKVRETADSFSRTISETKALIPSELSGNLLLKSNVGWSNVHDKNYVLADKLEKGKTYTLVAKYWHGQGATALTSTIGDGAWNRLSYNPAIDSWMVTFQAKADIPAGYQVYLASSPSTALGSSTFVTLVKGTIPLSRWEPAYSELATVTALHNVEDTVSSHTRTIGAVGETGSILDNVSKVTQTANGLVTEVSGTNGLKTQVSQLKNSWAVKNLSSSGQIIQQINLAEDGFLVDAAKIRLKGKTLADEIQAIEGKFGTLFVADGTFSKLKSTVISAKTITGEHILFDKAFFDKMLADEALFKTIYSKNAFLTAVQAVTLSASKIQGGVLEATNGALKMDLNNGQISFLQDSASIRRASSRSASQFMRFEDSGLVTMPGSGIPAAHTILGSNYLGNESSGNGFAGMEIYSGKYESLSRVVGDRIEFRANQGNKNLDNGNWVMDFKNRGDSYFYPQKGANTKNTYLGHMNSRITNVYVEDINLHTGHSLNGLLHNLASIAGHIVLGGFSDDAYKAIKDTYNDLRTKGYG